MHHAYRILYTRLNFQFASNKFFKLRTVSNAFRKLDKNDLTVVALLVYCVLYTSLSTTRLLCPPSPPSTLSSPFHPLSDS